MRWIQVNLKQLFRKQKVNMPLLGISTSYKYSSIWKSNFYILYMNICLEKHLRYRATTPHEQNLCEDFIFWGQWRCQVPLLLSTAYRASLRPYSIPIHIKRFAFAYQRPEQLRLRSIKQLVPMHFMPWSNHSLWEKPFIANLISQCPPWNLILISVCNFVNYVKSSSSKISIHAGPFPFKGIPLSVWDFFRAVLLSEFHIWIEFLRE